MRNVALMALAGSMLLGCATPAEQRRIAAALASLNAPGVTTRLNAVVTLGHKRHSHEIVEGLIGALGDSVPAIRVAALQALERIGASEVTMKPLLEAILRDPNPGVRYAAVMMYMNDRYRDKSTLGLMRQALRDSAATVRAAAAVAIGQLGEAGSAALDDLAVATRDPDEMVRHEARDAIDNITGERRHHAP